MVLPLLIKMEFEVNDQLFHCWSEIFPLKRHSYDLTGGQAWLWVSISVPECTWMSRVGRAIFRIKSYEKPFYVAAAVKPLVYVFSSILDALWHWASMALAPSCRVGTSRLARLSLRAGFHTRPPFLECLERQEQREMLHRPAYEVTSLDTA